RCEVKRSKFQHPDAVSKLVGDEVTSLTVPRKDQSLLTSAPAFTTGSRAMRQGQVRPPGLKIGASLVFGVWCLVFLLCRSADAQQYTIAWFTIDGGGGTSTGGVFSVSGTIGQPDAGGPMTGGNYSLTGGFWALPGVIQMPDGPTLH